MNKCCEQVIRDVIRLLEERANAYHVNDSPEKEMAIHFFMEDIEARFLCKKEIG